MTTQYKTIKTRLINKHDIAANWQLAHNNSSFTPLAGEIIIYDKEDNVPVRFKIGDGITKVGDLPFVYDLKALEDLEAHIQNKDVHWFENEKKIWYNITEQNIIPVEYNIGDEPIKDSGDEQIYNLRAIAQEDLDKIEFKVCGRNICDANVEFLTKNAVLPAQLPLELGATGGEQTKTLGLSNYVLIPSRKIIAYVNDGYTFNLKLLKPNGEITEYTNQTSLVIDNSNGEYIKLNATFNGENLEPESINFMIEDGETANGYAAYKGKTISYNYSASMGEEIIINENLMTYYNTTNFVANNLNFLFDYSVVDTENSSTVYSNGGRVITSLVTTKERGLMSPEDKIKLDDIQIASDEDFAIMMSSIGLIDIYTDNSGQLLADGNDNVLINIV